MGYSDADLFVQFSKLTQDLFLVLDREGTIVYINQTGSEILNEKTENILGLNWFDNFFDKSVNDEIKSVYLQLVSENMEFSRHYENTIVTKEKKELLMSWNNSTLYDEDGMIAYVLSLGRDITQERECASKLINSTMALEAAMAEMKGT